MNTGPTIVSALDFAAADGVADDTAGLQRALEGGRKTVFFPAGAYTVSTALKVFSHTRILAAPNALIRLADGAGKKQDDWLLCNADRTGGNDDIEIDGGTWDANCQANPRGDEYTPEAFAGVAVNFVGVRNLTLKNMTVCNPDSFFIRLGDVDGFRVEHIRLFNLFTRINQDGVHLGGGCRNGLIRSVHAITPFTPNDDMVALNADDDVTRHFNQGLRGGPIENIVIEDLYADSAYTFIRMLSQDHPITNIQVSHLRGGVRVNLLNLNCWRFARGKGAISNVLVRDVAIRKMPVQNTCPEAMESLPLCHIELNVKNFVIEDFVRLPAGCELADTLVLANNGANDLELEGLTAAQQRQLGDTMPAGVWAATGHGMAASNVDNVSLAGGGFKRLRLNCRR